jgi:hypothetical protein
MFICDLRYTIYAQWAANTSQNGADIPGGAVVVRHTFEIEPVR